MIRKACDAGRVLIVEDNAAARSLYAAIIAEDIPGITTDQASNGAEAVELFSASHHGVIVMDLHMPVMDGLKAYGEIGVVCQKNDWMMPAVIFCTAYAPPKSLADIVAPGRSHCLLVKPMKAGDLVGAIRQRIGLIKQQTA